MEAREKLARHLDDIRMVENQILPYASQIPATVESWGRLRAILSLLGDSHRPVSRPGEPEKEVELNSVAGSATPHRSEALEIREAPNLHDFGYEPGGYMNQCRRGDHPFIGDKRAWSCHPCALAAWEAKEAARTALTSGAPASDGREWVVLGSAKGNNQFCVLSGPNFKPDEKVRVREVTSGAALPGRPMKLRAEWDGVNLKVWANHPETGRPYLYMHYDIVRKDVPKEIAYRINAFEASLEGGAT